MNPSAPLPSGTDSELSPIPQDGAARDDTALLVPDGTSPEDTEAEPAVNKDERRALSIFALLAVAAVIKVAMPLGIGLLLGTLTAFTLQPLYRRMRLRWRSTRLAALVSVAVVLVGLSGVLGGFGYLFVVRGVAMAHSLANSLQPGGPVRAFSQRFGKQLEALHVPTSELLTKLRDAAGELTNRVAGVATVIAGVTAQGLLTVFFMVLTMYFILQNWNDVTRRLENMLPLNPRHSHALLSEFRRVGRSVLLGTVLTGIAQGVLAGLGYLVTRVPEAAFFGALTAVASLIPGVGTLLVWVPVGIYLLVTGHEMLGVLELVYGAVVVVGVSDYVIRPALVGGQGEFPALLTFIALFGGIEAFGLIGLILGPVIVSLSVALLRIYEREMVRQRGEAEDGAAERSTLAAPAS